MPRLQASIGVTCSYSSRPFLCALAGAIGLLFTKLLYGVEACTCTCAAECKLQLMLMLLSSTPFLAPSFHSNKRASAELRRFIIVSEINVLYSKSLERDWSGLNLEIDPRGEGTK